MAEAMVVPKGEPDEFRDEVRERWADADLVIHADGWRVYNLPDAEAVAEVTGMSPEVSDPLEAFHAALDAATTLDEVKAALKGSASTPGAEPRRGRPDHAG